MNENTEDRIPKPQRPHGTLKLWHPAGTLVFLPLTDDRVDGPIDYAAMFANTSAAIAAGWMVNAPGTEPGEEKYTIGYCMRAVHERDGEETPIIDLYAPEDNMTWRFFRHYLNDRQAVGAFETATGLTLEKMPINVGGGSIQRGASKQTNQLFCKLPKPCDVILKHNPKYDPDETDVTKKKPKNLFVRWADLRQAAAAAMADKPAVAAAPQSEPGKPSAVDSEKLKYWTDWLGRKPSLAALNDGFAKDATKLPGPVKAAAWQATLAYAVSNQWHFDRKKNEFVVGEI